MNDGQLLTLLTALGVLLATAHLAGMAAVRLHQPRVTGELVGGLLLGPTVLGLLVPAVQTGLFPPSGPVSVALGVVKQLGLLMLMFLTGTEVRRLLPRENRRVTGWVVATGLVLPFGAGIAAASVVDLSGFAGPAASPMALTLIVASAVAVTSIPVISRIMLDLGLLSTSFAAVVLSAAVLEDVVLYMVIAIAVGLAQAPGQATSGLPALLHLSGPPALSAYYAVATVFLFALLPVLVAAGRAALRRWGPSLSAPLPSTVACVTLMIGCAAGAAALGGQPMFGAFVAGVAVGRLEAGTGTVLTNSCRSFAFAFFLPLYFASIGLALNLGRDLVVGFTVLLITVACVVKLGSVFTGARLGGVPRGRALHLAFAMNARGGPGIVVASVALSAGIVDQRLYTTLILLAVTTSLLAGAWLRSAVDRGALPRGDDEVAERSARAPQQPAAPEP